MHNPSPSVLLILLAPFVLWAVLFVLSEFGQVPLKPLSPWLATALGLLGGPELSASSRMVRGVPAFWRYTQDSAWCWGGSSEDICSRT